MATLAALGIGGAIAGSAAAGGTAAAAGGISAGTVVTGLLAGASIAGTVATGVQKYQNEQQMAQYNTAIYEQQMAQVEAQKLLSQRQTDTKKRSLIGKVSSQAGASGLKLTGSTVDSLNQSLTNMGIDEGLNQYNLNTTSSKLSSGADYQKSIGNDNSAALLINTGTSILTQGKDYYSKYWRK